MKKAHLLLERRVRQLLIDLDFESFSTEKSSRLHASLWCVCGLNCFLSWRVCASPSPSLPQNMAFETWIGSLLVEFKIREWFDTNGNCELSHGFVYRAGRSRTPATLIFAFWKPLGDRKLWYSNTEPFYPTAEKLSGWYRRTESVVKFMRESRNQSNDSATANQRGGRDGHCGAHTSAVSLLPTAAVKCAVLRGLDGLTCLIRGNVTKKQRGSGLQ